MNFGVTTCPPMLRAGEGEGEGPSEVTYRRFEFAAFFGVMPALFAMAREPIPVIVGLGLLTLVTLSMLLTDPTFDRGRLRDVSGLREGWPRVVGLWCVGVLVLGLMVSALAPDQLLNLPRQRPGLWALVMVAYPVLSVVPQNIVYRAFIFHRYACVFRSPRAMVWASACAFSWAHVVFWNPVALMLTLAGGLVFAETYARRPSVPLVSLEHALYGCLVFTVGLGGYLYQG